MFTLNTIKKSQLVSGPVREIGVQVRSITGTMPNGNRYESALERDFMLLMDFDLAVDVYTPQPLTIRYQDRDGDWHRYTPDGLVEWRKDLKPHDPRPLLVEIKYREAFQGEWRVWRERMRAARRYAEERGWQFLVITERDIRNPFLDNVRFLLPYRRRPGPVQTDQWVLDKLTELIESTPQELIESLYQDKWNRAALIPVVWCLLAERRIGCDLTQPLTMQSTLWTLR
ncbi:TnsA endonuclease N-terminal domain-containing protein [Xylophilus ampelinus]|uniref:TnsA endonuclease-like protein n=1 Tax=Xylophilus ampelinus TaxID=54067 RepID=A0A318SI00_9BURK|nr:TnsA endonuclease N-terminal domain-containing protein [Xylophilus ampelinus]MCS4509969.1 TnsA endonuclease N-terminal domain-containing protein [Xylophilus ampelinus]PYE78453.1 TnsA endonuclease-like protein [Xylophilus ampelinus]